MRVVIRCVLGTLTIYAQSRKNDSHAHQPYSQYNICPRCIYHHFNRNKLSTQLKITMGHTFYTPSPIMFALHPEVGTIRLTAESVRALLLC
jgi:hypothetical protein